ncbi:MAG: hypothetical protein ACYCWC_12630 [Rhodocyclaceae bacterium]
MTKKTRVRAPVQEDANPKTTDSHNHTTTDKLIVWINLSKPARGLPTGRILERHYCYCQPAATCIFCLTFCLTWSRLLRRLEAPPLAWRVAA